MPRKKIPRIINPRRRLKALYKLLKKYLNMIDLTEKIILRKCDQCFKEKPETSEFFRLNKSANKKSYLIHKCRECAAFNRRMKNLERGLIKYPFCVLPGYKYCGKCKQVLELEIHWNGGSKCIHCIRRDKNQIPRRIGRETNLNEKECFTCNLILPIKNFPIENKKLGRCCRSCSNKKIAIKAKKNIEFKITRNFRGSVRDRLHGHKKSSSFDLLDCNIENFKKYLEEKFQDGMTWGNYGKIWVLDHILPCNLFDLKELEAQKLCFHFTNYQPLFRLENILKCDKMPNGTPARKLPKVKNKEDLNKVLFIYA